MSGPDFVHLNDQPVRVTSFSRDGDRVKLVIVLRGSRAHSQLREALERTPLLLTVPGEPEREMSVEQNEHVTSGEGERTLYRHSVVLGPTSGEPPATTDDVHARLDRIEHKLDAILRRLEERSPNEPGPQAR